MFGKCRNFTSLSECPRITDPYLKHIDAYTSSKGFPWIAHQLRTTACDTSVGSPTLSLALESDGITDSGLRHISSLTNLEELTLKSDTTTGTGLQHIRGLTNLQWLNLECGKVADDGVPHLWGLRKLEGFRYMKT